jgi:hypothetical protein
VEARSTAGEDGRTATAKPHRGEAAEWEVPIVTVGESAVEQVRREGKREKRDASRPSSWPARRIG